MTAPLHVKGLSCELEWAQERFGRPPESVKPHNCQYIYSIVPFFFCVLLPLFGRIMSDMVKPILFGLPHAIPVISDFFYFRMPSRPSWTLHKPSWFSANLLLPLRKCAHVVYGMSIRKNPCFKRSPRNQTLQRRQKENHRREVGTNY